MNLKTVTAKRAAMKTGAMKPPFLTRRVAMKTGAAKPMQMKTSAATTTAMRTMAMDKGKLPEFQKGETNLQIQFVDRSTKQIFFSVSIEQLLHSL